MTFPLYKNRCFIESIQIQWFAILIYTSSMKCTILGCGGSLGVPQILCDCDVCTSGDPKNIRSRASIYIESGETAILIDSTPDFRAQAIGNNIKKLSHILITHHHADHISGIDDVKPLILDKQEKTEIYLSKESYDAISGSYSYLFNSRSNVYKTILTARIIEPYQTFMVGSIEVRSFLQHHGEVDSLGFRFGDMAYSTDIKRLPEESLEILKDVDTWIIDCLKYTESPSHLNYSQTIEYIEKVKPRRAILTHMGHEMEYTRLRDSLPKNVEPGYDGMVINL